MRFWLCVVIWLLGVVFLWNLVPEEYYKQQQFDATLVQKWEDWRGESPDPYTGAFLVETPRGVLEDVRKMSARDYSTAVVNTKWTITDSLNELDAPAYSWREANAVTLLMFWVFFSPIAIMFLMFWLED